MQPDSCPRSVSRPRSAPWPGRASLLGYLICSVACSPEPPQPGASSRDTVSTPDQGVGGARAPIAASGGSSTGGASSSIDNPWLHGIGAAGEGAGGASNAAGGDAISGGGVGGSSDIPEDPEPPVLLISQYFEGQGADKALELTNLAATAAHLEECTLNVYANGSVTPYRTASLTGTLSAGASLVYCTSVVSDALRPACGVTLTALVYNGNDAVVLRCGDEVVDSFGRVGEDPGAAWGAESPTKNSNLVRRCAVPGGDTVPDDAFVPEAEWRAVPLTETSDFGLRMCPDEEGAGGAGGVADGFSLPSAG